MAEESDSAGSALTELRRTDCEGCVESSRFTTLFFLDLTVFELEDLAFVVRTAGAAAGTAKTGNPAPTANRTTLVNANRSDMCRKKSLNFVLLEQSKMQN